MSGIDDADVKVFGLNASLKPYDPSIHAPFVGLINPKSGGQVGQPILNVCKRTDVYKTNIFHIVEVIKSASQPDGLFAQFRTQLNEAKAKAMEIGKPEFRPRLICGGGDGTASFALLIVFKALLAEANSGMPDTGNGFTWTDEEMQKYFPALVQMPLGTGNDLSGVLGWNRKPPGYTAIPCAGRGRKLSNLRWWFDSALSVQTPVQNFDVWGFMPPPGEDRMDLKLCELAKVVKANGKKQLLMKEAEIVVPFMVLLYSSFGFGAQVVSRFQLNRKGSQFLNTVEYGKIIPQVMLGSTPAQTKYQMEGFKINMPDGSPPEKNGTNQYFPPRPTRKDRKYSEVGFLNLNSYSGGNMHGSDRAGCFHRWILCRGSSERRKPVTFDDGFMDLFRQRQPATAVKTGKTLQTDKRKGAVFEFEAAKSQGVFIQYDGEGRFAFHPEGKAWRMDVHQILRIPVVIGPGARRSSSDEPVGFSFVGDDTEVQRVKARIKRWVNGELADELNAKEDEIDRAGLPLMSRWDGKGIKPIDKE